MPYLLCKEPLSDFRVEYYDSKKLSDLQSLLNLNLNPIPLGSGIVMLVQLSNEFDVPNVIYDDSVFYGKIYFVKASSNRILDISFDDLIPFLDSLNFNSE